MKFNATDIIDILYDLEHTASGVNTSGSAKLIALLYAVTDQLPELQPDTIELWVSFGYKMGRQQNPATPRDYRREGYDVQTAYTRDGKPEAQPEPDNPFSRPRTIKPKGNML